MSIPKYALHQQVPYFQQNQNDLIRKHETFSILQKLKDQFFLKALSKHMLYKFREVSQIWNFFKIIWFLQIFQNGLIFKIWLSSSRDIQILVLRKREYFQTGLKGNLHVWNGTKKKNFDRLFCHFLGINTHNFVKSDLKLENKCLFCAELYGAWYKNFFWFQNCDIWGLWHKTSLGQFALKSLSKRRIKP